MEKEVESAVLAVINEKRLKGEKRTPVEIIAKMGVFDARDKASDYAWLATGGHAIATVWAELVSIGAGGQWFYLEPLESTLRLDGSERSAQQAQRAKDRLQILKRAFDAAQAVRVVLQTNRVAIAGLEADKMAKVSTRVPDDQEWHVASWDADLKMAALVRGARGWVPAAADLDAAKARSGVPAVPPAPPPAVGSLDQVQAAALDYLTRHFAGYGYKPANVSGQGLGYDIEVTDKKGATLLQLAVKGIGSGVASFRLSSEEREAAKRGDPWRLAVVSDPLGPAAHKLYKPSEIESASGLTA